MASKILFNIASRNRPGKCAKVIQQIITMCSQPYEIILKIDTNDPMYRQYRSLPANIKLGKFKSKVHAVNRDIPLTDWDILVDVNDDFVFTQHGFDDIIREHCGPNDVVHFPEPYSELNTNRKGRDAIIIMPVMGREYYNRFGYVYNPAYKAVFCDNELTAVAKLTGAYKRVDIPIFYHAHPAAGYGKKDALLKHNESFWDRDEAVYNQRQAKNFDLPT